MTAIFFGDPDHPRRLRDLLEQRIELVPAGGEIAWITYYFRDEALADALIRAHRRGVRVRLSVEGNPRLRCANDRVLARLASKATGIGDGLRIARRGLFRHLHEKLYCFSHPYPAALAGSFNPSGNRPDEPAVFAKIGDQDRAHNFLAEISGRMAGPLIEHARALHGRMPRLFQRLSRRWTAPVRSRGLAYYLFPRLTHPLDARLDALGAGSRLRIAASHLRDTYLVSRLCGLSARGVEIELFTEHTDRRVPGRIERMLCKAGIGFTRYRHPDGLPMHNKFLLAETESGRWSAFGSLNLTLTSRWLNTELLLVSADDKVFDRFARRWDRMQAENARWLGTA